MSKWKILMQWESELPDRYDPAMAAQDKVDERGWIIDYENSYDMHHKVVEATAEEIKDLFARYERAEKQKRNEGGRDG